MTAIAGRFAQLEVSQDGGCSYEIACVVDANLSGSVDELEVTDHCSGCVRKYVPNFIEAELTASMRYDESNPGFGIIANSSFEADRVLKFRLIPSQDSLYVYEAEGFVTSFDAAFNLDDAASYDVTIRLTSLRRIGR